MCWKFLVCLIFVVFAKCKKFFTMKISQITDILWPIQYMKYAGILASSYSGINHKKQVLVCMSITVQENSQPLVQCMLMP